MAEAATPSMMDFAKAGVVQQDAAAQGMAGMQAGADLAMAYEKHQASMQEFQNKQAQFKEQQAEWANGQLGNILSIENPNMRAFKFKQFMKTAQVAGVQVDPAAELLIKDNDFAKKAHQGYLAANGLPYDQRTSQWMDQMQWLGDASLMEKAVQGAGGTTAQNRSTAMQGHVAELNYNRELEARKHTYAIDAEKAIRENQAQMFTDNKDRFEQLHFANQILDNVDTAAKRNDPVRNAAVKSGLAKILFPGGVIRESEVKFLEDMSPGLGQKVEGFVKGKLGYGDLTKQQLMLIGKYAQYVGDRAHQEFRQQIGAKAPYLRSIGVDPEDVASIAPSWGSTPEERHRKAAVVPVAGPASGAPAASPVDIFKSQAPEAQQKVIDMAKKFGINLDPKADDFGVNLALLIQKGRGGGAPAATPTPTPAPAAQPSPAVTQ